VARNLIYLPYHLQSAIVSCRLIQRLLYNILRMNSWHFGPDYFMHRKQWKGHIFLNFRQGSYSVNRRIVFSKERYTNKFPAKNIFRLHMYIFEVFYPELGKEK
jgi:hypothetical protein